MKYFFSLAILTVISLSGFSQVKNYKYDFKVNGLKDTDIYLANYYGKKQYYKDTARVDNMGRFTFKGDSIAGGIYLIVLPNKKGYFEFIVNEPSLSMETDTNDLVGKMKIKGSLENEKFYQYMAEMQKYGGEAQKLKSTMDAETDVSKKAEFQKQIDGISAQVKTFQLQFIEENKNLFASKVFKASVEPEVPDFTEIENEEERNKMKYMYYKNHYLDNIDFGDNRMLRTPIMHNKMEYYITKLTLQVPDSINKSADFIMKKSTDKEIARYNTIWITNHYESSKIMGMDAVFVHMVENYYTKEKAYWVEDEKLKKIQDRASKLKPLLLDEVTPNIILVDTTEKNWVDLAKINNKFTLLYFWDPNCGHCKKATPQLHEFYVKNKEKYNLEVYAVSTDLENADWKKFIQKHNLTWINVSDSPEINKNAYSYLQYTTVNSLNFRDIYDIFSTPQLYVLDAEKRIIGKKMGVEQVEDFMEKYTEQEGKKSNQN